MSIADLTRDVLATAEERFERGDLDGAMKLLEALTMQLPNSSKNHRMLLRYLAAYSVHMISSQNGSHYDILKISDPACSQETIERKYEEIVDELDPKRNASVAAKGAWKMVLSAGSALSNPLRRRIYDKKKGFVKRTQRLRINSVLREQEPQTRAKRPSREKF